MPKKGGKGGKDDKGKGKGKGKDEPPDVSVQVCRAHACSALVPPETGLLVLTTDIHVGVTVRR